MAHREQGWGREERRSGERQVADAGEDAVQPVDRVGTVEACSRDRQRCQSCAVAVIHARPWTVERSAHAYTGSDRPNVTNPAVISQRVSEPTAANRLMASSIEEYGAEVAAAPMTHAPMNPAGPITPPRVAFGRGRACRQPRGCPTQTTMPSPMGLGFTLRKRS